VLENPRSPRVRKVAALQKKSERRDTGLFLVEGPQSLREALMTKPELLREVYATPTALERHTDIAQLLTKQSIEAQFISEDVLEAMSETVTPQGFVAVCQQFLIGVKTIFSKQPSLVVVLEEVRDPGNAGTIIRAADAAGADAVVLSGRSIDVINPKVVRSTTGSLFHLPIAVTDELATVVNLAQQAGAQTLAADISGDDLTAARAEGMLKHPTVWVFGNEARGLSDEDLALATRVLRVPIFGQAESMNLATAASVCLFETAFEQRS
jgi:TrmH family RNA methyltransferase